MNEFELIERIVSVLGRAADGEHVRLGPGDDAAIVALPPGRELVSSIDSLVSGLHFPAHASPYLIGYRCVAVSASDLAAMGALPSHALVALTLPDANDGFCAELTRGMAAAAGERALPIVGGNLARGSLSVQVSVHGHVARGQALRRDGAAAGDRVYVSGPLGGAAAALRGGDLDEVTDPGDLSTVQRSYFLPSDRIPLAARMCGVASAAIDVSDGLVQDARHVATASGVRIDIDGQRIPLQQGATLEDALASDDYELLVCMSEPASEAFGDLLQSLIYIGRVVDGSGVYITDAPGASRARGYQHFS